MEEAIEIVENFQETLESVDVRILSGKKKSSYRTARVKGFPVVETCEEFRRKVDDLLPGERCKSGFSFGFIEKKNKKIWVMSDDQLTDAYAAAVGGQPLWIDPNEASFSTTEPQTRKRPNEEEDAGTAKNPSNVETTEDRIKNRIKSLEDVHGKKYQPYQYRLWAEMLVLGSHTNEQEPPPLPIFTGGVKVAKRPRTSSSTPLTSAMSSSHESS